MPTEATQGEDDEPTEADGDGDGEGESSDSEESSTSRFSDDVLNPEQWPVVSRISVSGDGQWFASTDLMGRTHVFNVDAVKVGRISLFRPTF